VKINLVKWVKAMDVVRNDKEMLDTLLRFYTRLKSAQWKTANDIIKTFDLADIIKCTINNRVVFNVNGSKYRLITGYFFAIN